VRRDKLLLLMERLDSQYAEHKKLSTDAKSTEERATAAEKLAEREVFLQPTYKQLALLYADLHEYVFNLLSLGVKAEVLDSRTGRMEAKGCAKSMQWRNARRYFYWALRARLARSSALSRIQAASPESTPEERSRLLNSLLPTTDILDHRVLAPALETLNLEPTLQQLRRAVVVENMLSAAHSDLKAALEGILRVADLLSDEEKVTLIANLQAIRSGKPVPRVEKTCAVIVHP
jgi:acetyl-CoA carboxylase/biotin carboxylase 1